MAGARRSGLGIHGDNGPAGEGGRRPRGSRPGPLGLDLHESSSAPEAVWHVRQAVWIQTRGEPLEAPPPPPAPAARPPKPLKEGWVEIEVVDRDGRPVVGQPYKLELPDGRVMEGRLGSSGLISVHAIDPGQVTLSFPELDRPA